MRERFVTRDQLVQQCTESPNVCVMIDGFAFHLLRSHVLERSDDRLFLGEVFLLGGRLGRARRRFVRRESGQAEVQKLHAGLREHRIAGFQVAMDNAGSMRGVQFVGDLNPVFLLPVDIS